MFVCRTCRKEVLQEEDGTYSHVEDGSPACPLVVPGADTAGWDRHEKLESSDDVASQLQAEEEVKNS
jgi:hypothetical protein